MTLLLGIDTGGTYTDAVLYDEARSGDRVVAKAKALTTRHDLAIGVGGAVDAALAASGADPAAVGLVSVSTTLATNALVEGQGGRVALAFIGFAEEDAKRAGLDAALGGDPLIRVAGGHLPSGDEQAPLDRDALTAAAARVAGSVEGFAVVAQFGVRNPAHEIAARDLIRAATGLPVTCGHELSAKLNGPKRALTSVLNARLIGMVAELIEAVEATLAARGLHAPLMLVRGDGSLVSAAFARARPIETILSGPAASLIGAAALTGAQDAVISDIGGTTTDIAILRGGRPALSARGATVGGHETMVEAVDMATHGIGGDSAVGLSEGPEGARLAIGPRRLIPVSLLGRDWPDVVGPALERQRMRETPGAHDARFVLAEPRAAARLGALSEADGALWRSLGAAPAPVDAVAPDRRALAALDRLVARGFARLSGFTPSDAAHVLGLHRGWRSDFAAEAASLFARRRDAMGRPLAATAEEIAARVVEALVRRSAEALLDRAFVEDGVPATAADRLAAAALDRRASGLGGVARIEAGLTLPVIGLGASAPVYYPRIAAMLGAEAMIPAHADVANAVGAVAGRVEIRRETVISQPTEGVFRVHGADGRDFAALDSARAHAAATLRARILAEAEAAGAADVEIAQSFAERTATVEGRPVFIEGVLSLRASGRPRL